jgi:hypothetical protein
LSTSAHPAGAAATVVAGLVVVAAGAVDVTLDVTVVGDDAGDDAGDDVVDLRLSPSSPQPAATMASTKTNDPAPAGLTTHPNG